MLQGHWAGRLGEALRCQRSGGKPWPGSLWSDFSLVWGIPGAQLCAGVHLGAVRERCGELSELRNRLSGSFRSFEIGSQSPLSDHFGGMFDVKAGRWQCGAHAMAENTKSHETYSTLSGNAVNVNIFFQGRRMWPLARKSADPGEACGSVLKLYVFSTCIIYSSYL